jgi:Fe2+ transport system protein B
MDGAEVYRLPLFPLIFLLEIFLFSFYLTLFVDKSVEVGSGRSAFLLQVQFVNGQIESDSVLHLIVGGALLWSEWNSCVTFSPPIILLFCFILSLQPLLLSKR